MIYGLVVLTIFYCMALKQRSSFPSGSRAVELFYSALHGVMLTTKSTVDKSKTDYSSLLHTFLIVWVTLSTLLLDTAYVPLLALNILLEKCVYFVFSTSTDLPQLDLNYLYGQMFYRLGVYLTLANSAFYQIGNTNSLSSVSVKACFIGLDAYLPIPCTIFMVISVYSTYIYWFIMFFVRIQQDLMPANNGSSSQLNHSSQLNDEYDNSSEETLGETRVEDETQQFINNLISRKNPIVLNYCTFYSITNCLLITRLLVMTMNMTVTYILRDHLFIWSVICPKLLYEIIFSALNLAIALIMSVIFTHDNYFHLH